MLKTLSPWQEEDTSDLLLLFSVTQMPQSAAFTEAIFPSEMTNKSRLMISELSFMFGSVISSLLHFNIFQVFNLIFGGNFIFNFLPISFVAELLLENRRELLQGFMVGGPTGQAFIKVLYLSEGPSFEFV